MTNKDRKVLGRFKRDVDKGEIDSQIQNTLKLNKMDLIDPFDNTMKNSLFFRLNVSGRIESAKVTKFKIIDLNFYFVIIIIYI